LWWALDMTRARGVFLNILATLGIICFFAYRLDFLFPLSSLFLAISAFILFSLSSKGQSVTSGDARWPDMAGYERRVCAPLHIRT